VNSGNRWPESNSKAATRAGQFPIDPGEAPLSTRSREPSCRVPNRAALGSCRCTPPCRRQRPHNLAGQSSCTGQEPSNRSCRPDSVRVSRNSSARADRGHRGTAVQRTYRADDRGSPCNRTGDDSRNKPSQRSSLPGRCGRTLGPAAESFPATARVPRPPGSVLLASPPALPRRLAI